MLVFQSACAVRELTKYRHHLLLRRQAFVKLDSISGERRLSLFHFALSVREVDPERFELFCSLLRRSSQAQKALSEGRTRLAALDTGVRHEAGQRGGLFHRRAESLGHRCGILHRLAHELDGRVGICDRIGEHVRHVRRVFRRQSEGRQIIGKNIRRPGEVRPAGCCEGKHGPHTGENLLRLPARHTEVCHGLRRLRRREARRLAELPSLCRESCRILGRRVRNRLYSRHSGLEGHGRLRHSD